MGAFLLIIPGHNCTEYQDEKIIIGGAIVGLRVGGEYRDEKIIIGEAIEDSGGRVGGEYQDDKIKT